MRIVITGGHHTPALAVIRELQKRGINNVHWIGHKYSLWQDTEPCAEYKTITAVGIPFYELKAGKAYKNFNPLKLVRVPLGFWQAFTYLRRIKPDLIISFGGYLAVPVVIVGWLMGIPSVTHEQTIVVGLANRVIAKFARKIFLTWSQSAEFFGESVVAFPPAASSRNISKLPERNLFRIPGTRRRKVILTGNPLRSEIFKVDRKFKRQIFQDGKACSPKLQRRRVIYITGGKQGAHIINEAVLKALPELLKKYTVIHQSGRASLFRDYERLQEFKERLGKRETVAATHASPKLEVGPVAARVGHASQLQKYYILKDYVGEDEIGTIFDVADLVISRAGANIVYELAALGKPAILIPIPWVSHDEQNKNAQLLVRAGSAVILPEKDLSAETLIIKVEEVFSNFRQYQKAAKKAKSLIIPNAAKKMVDALTNLHE